MLSGARNHRFRGEATLPQRILVIEEEVNDMVQYLWWEAGVRHRGLSQGENCHRLPPVRVEIRGERDVVFNGRESQVATIRRGIPPTLATRYILVIAPQCVQRE